MINLFYLSNNTTGGWVTFTHHLIYALQAEDVDFRLFKHGKNTETCKRPFGYGRSYRNITAEDALELEGVNVIVAAAKQHADMANSLLEEGAKIVLHDPTELKGYLNASLVKNPWVIRKAVLRYLERNYPDMGGTFIRHPYCRVPEECDAKRRKVCVSTSRIDFDKHTEILLDAKRLGAPIEIHGFENRLYTKFKICPKYPEWEQSKAAYPREARSAWDILRRAALAVDMSLIKGDGGGTQYTFLEAWDAGTPMIIHSGWIMEDDDMKPGLNCMTAGDGESLAKLVKKLLRDPETRDKLSAMGQASLGAHSPEVIGPQVVRWMVD